MFNRIKQAIEERKQHKGVMLRNSTAPEKFTFGEMCEYLEALQNQQFSDFKSSSEAMEVDTLVFSLESRAEWSLAQLAELKEEVDSIFYASNYNSNGRNIDVVDVVYEETAPSRLEIYVSSSEGQSNNANWAFTTSSNCNFFTNNGSWPNSPYISNGHSVSASFRNFLYSSASPFRHYYYTNLAYFFVNINTQKADVEGTYSNNIYYDRGVSPTDPPLLFKQHSTATGYPTWGQYEMNLWMCRFITFFQTVTPAGHEIITVTIDAKSKCLGPAFNNFCGAWNTFEVKHGKPFNYNLSE